MFFTLDSPIYRLAIDFLYVFCIKMKNLHIRFVLQAYKKPYQLCHQIQILEAIFHFFQLFQLKTNEVLRSNIYTL